MISSHRHGFTLLELSIVLIIVALVLGLTISLGTGVLASARQVATMKKMAAIENALMAYRSAYDRLPCPANLKYLPGSTYFGVEASNPGNCLTDTSAGSATPPAANFGSTSYNFNAAAEGAVPVATLGLPNDFMFDGWGNRFRYAIDVTYTQLGAFAATGAGFDDSDFSPGIMINSVICSSSGCQAPSWGQFIYGGVYALISHGPNGHAAYNYYGNVAPIDGLGVNRVSCPYTGSGRHKVYHKCGGANQPPIGTAEDTGALDQFEAQNCHCTLNNGTFEDANSGASSGIYYFPTYYRGPLNNGTPLTDVVAGGATTFDDIVDFRTRSQLALPRDNMRASAQWLAIAGSTNGGFATPAIGLALIINGNIVNGMTGSIPGTSLEQLGLPYRLAFSYDDLELYGVQVSAGGSYVSGPYNIGIVGQEYYNMLVSGLGIIQSGWCPAIPGSGSVAPNCPAVVPLYTDGTQFFALSPDKNSRLLAVPATSTTPGRLQLYSNSISGSPYTVPGYIMSAQGVNVADPTSINNNTSAWATVEWSPNGKNLYYVSPTPTPYLFQYSLQGNTLAISSTANVNLSTYMGGLYSLPAIGDLSVHPSGNYLALASGQHILLFSLPITSSTPTLLSATNTTYGITSIAWSPDGTLLAADDGGVGLNIYSFSQSTGALTAGTVSAGTSGQPAQCGRNLTGLSKPAWSADSGTLAVAADTPLLCIYLRSGSTLTLTSSTNAYNNSTFNIINALAFSHVAPGITSAP